MLSYLILQLQQLGEREGRTDLSLEKLCADRDLESIVLKELQAHGLKAKLQRFEIPGAICLCTESWTPDTELVTAAFKLKRKNIQQHYQSQINRMYGTK
jgi:long-chain acyl-CoA synthetase